MWNTHPLPWHSTRVSQCCPPVGNDSHCIDPCGGGEEHQSRECSVDAGGGATTAERAVEHECEQVCRVDQCQNGGDDDACDPGVGGLTAAVGIAAHDNGRNNNNDDKWR